MVLKLKSASKSPGGLVRIQTTTPAPRVSDSVGLEWILRISLPHKALADAICWVRDNHCTLAYLAWVDLFSTEPISEDSSVSQCHT